MRSPQGIDWCNSLLKSKIKVKDPVCFAPVFITYNKLYLYIASIFCKTSVTSVLYQNNIVINIMIIAVMYTAKSQPTFVDSRRRDDTYGLRSLACIQSQSRTTGDREYLHGNNRRSCCSTLLTKDSFAQFDVSYGIPEGVSKLVGSDQKSAPVTN